MAFIKQLYTESPIPNTLKAIFEYLYLGKKSVGSYQAPKAPIRIKPQIDPNIIKTTTNIVQAVVLLSLLASSIVLIFAVLSLNSSQNIYDFQTIVNDEGIFTQLLDKRTGIIYTSFSTPTKTYQLNWKVSSKTGLLSIINKKYTR
ncbi:MAG: hypothetical protein WC527_02310 [Candidatus Margulisiibacteriota bacterium]